MADYILNMGGYTSDSPHYSDVVDVFRTMEKGIELVTDHGLSLSVARQNIATAAAGNYVLAMGGDMASRAYSDAVDVFKATENGIEQITDHNLSLSAGRRTTAAAAGNYILALGGYDGSVFYDTVDVFKVTENGVEEITGHGLALSEGKVTVGAACGNYILALGGNPGTGATDAIDVFKVTENGIEHILNHGLTLSVARRAFATATCGNYIFAMGGYDSTKPVNAVDIFKVTESGIEHITDHELSLSVARRDLAGAACGNYILALGGSGPYSATPYYDTIDVFKVTDNGVEKVTVRNLSLSVARGYLSAAAMGKYIVALGGRDNTNYLDTIDVFQIVE